MISEQARKIHFDFNDLVKAFKLKEGEIIDDLEVRSNNGGVVSIDIFVVKRYGD